MQPGRSVARTPGGGGLSDPSGRLSPLCCQLKYRLARWAIVVLKCDKDFRSTPHSQYPSGCCFTSRRVNLDVRDCGGHVRFSSNSGKKADIAGGPRWAISRHHQAFEVNRRRDRSGSDRSLFSARSLRNLSISAGTSFATYWGDNSSPLAGIKPRSSMRPCKASLATAVRSAALSRAIIGSGVRA